MSTVFSISGSFAGGARTTGTQSISATGGAIRVTATQTGFAGGSTVRSGGSVVRTRPSRFTETSTVTQINPFTPSGGGGRARPPSIQPPSVPPSVPPGTPGVTQPPIPGGGGVGLGRARGRRGVGVPAQQTFSASLGGGISADAFRLQASTAGVFKTGLKTGLRKFPRAEALI